MIKKIDGKEIPDIAQNEAENVHWIKPKQLQAIVRKKNQSVKVIETNTIINMLFKVLS